MQDLGKAQTDAYLKSVYGDAIKIPEPPRQIAGGQIDSGQHIDLGRLLDGRKRPKSSPWPWICTAVVLLALIGSGLLVASWLIKPTPEVPKGVQVPGNFGISGGPFQP
jgi:hypothetical protein